MGDVVALRDVRAERARIEAIKARLAIISAGYTNRRFHQDEIAHLRAELEQLEAGAPTEP